MTDRHSSTVIRVQVYSNGLRDVMHSADDEYNKPHVAAAAALTALQEEAVSEVRLVKVSM